MVIKDGNGAVVCRHPREYRFELRREQRATTRSEEKAHKLYRGVVVVLIACFTLAVLILQAIPCVESYRRKAVFAEEEYGKIQSLIARESTAVGLLEKDDCSFIVSDDIYITLRGQKVERVDDGEMRESIMRFAKDYECNNGNEWRSALRGAVFNDYAFVVIVTTIVLSFVCWLVWQEGFPFEDRLVLNHLCRNGSFSG